MSAIAAHAAIADRYDNTPNPLLALEHRLALPLLPCLHGRVAVDVACGTGRWAKELARLGARLIALDRCPEMLLHAPRPAVLADAAQIPLPDACADFTICAFALSYTGPCLSELTRITRPGGVVMISDMHPEAMRRGWTRISVEAVPYTIDSLHGPGLHPVHLLEAAFEECDLDLFTRAGRRGIIESVRNVPAVFVAQWIRK